MGRSAGMSMALDGGAARHRIRHVAGKTAAASARRNNMRLASTRVRYIFERDGETQRERSTGSGVRTNALEHY
jgi:hypothetical protein